MHCIALLLKVVKLVERGLKRVLKLLLVARLKTSLKNCKVLISSAGTYGAWEGTIIGMIREPGDFYFFEIITDTGSSVLISPDSIEWMEILKKPAKSANANSNKQTTQNKIEPSHQEAKVLRLIKTE